MFRDPSGTPLDLGVIGTIGTEGLIGIIDLFVKFCHC